MRTKNTLGQIQPVVEDVTESIDKCSRSLEQFFKDPESIVFEQESMQQLKKLSGVFTMLDMQGAARLIKDTLLIVSRVQSQPETVHPAQFQAISYALAMLSRYVDYVRNKHFDLPELLLPVINDLRKVAGAPSLDESFFFVIAPDRSRKSSDKIVKAPTKRAKLSRYYRQMYQMGLIEVLRKSNIGGGLKMMRRALRHFEYEIGHPTAPNLWWIAQAVMHSFARKDLMLANRRLNLFSNLDRQMREMGNLKADNTQKPLASANQLARYSLYLVAIAQSADPASRKIRAFFNIPEQDVNDRVLQSESLLIHGPAHKDYESLAEAIHEELDKISAIIKDQDNSFQQNAKTAIKRFSDISRLLAIINLDQETTRVEVVIDLIKTAMAKENHQKELKMVDIAIEQLREALAQNDALVPVSKLETKVSFSNEQQMACKATRAGLQTLMKTLDDYSRQSFPRELLERAAEQMNKVVAGIEALKINELEVLTKSTEEVFKRKIILAAEDNAEQKLSRLADILASIEFYLETVENRQTPSQKIVSFAGQSLDELKKIK